MPRAFSIAIQSDTVARRSPLPWTAPASVITRACRASASVRVDLPASGWLMTANVRRGRVSGTGRIYRQERSYAASATRARAGSGELEHLGDRAPGGADQVAATDGLPAHPGEQE